MGWVEFNVNFDKDPRLATVAGLFHAPGPAANLTDK
jgi:hypothetical protein